MDMRWTRRVNHGGALKSRHSVKAISAPSVSPARNHWMNDISIDRAAMGRLATALTFICGADHPTTSLLKTASDSGLDQDISKARKSFLKLKPSDRKAAMAMLEDD